MNFDNNNNNNISKTGVSFSNKLNLKEEFSKYLKKWYWFVLSLLLFLSLAFVYLRYAKPQYNVSATLAISAEDNISESGYEAFKELGIVSKAQNKIENEIQLLKSKTLIRSIIERKKLNIQYFSEGSILETENYPKSIIKINFLETDSIINSKSKDFYIKINSKTQFSLVNKKTELLSNHLFGKTIKTDVGDVIITPDIKDIVSHTGEVIRVKLRPVKSLVEDYRRRLNIYQSQNSSSILHISLEDPIVNKATDFINTLINDYGEATIAHKRKISNKTSNFIRERLDLINKDLVSVEGEAAGYKSKFGLSGDVTAQTERVASFDSENSQRRSEVETQLRLINSMQNFINSQDGKNNVIPGNIGLDDPSIANSISRYNALMVQRKRLLKTSSQLNPVVINVEEEINSIRQVLKSSLSRLRSSAQIKLNSLETSGKYFSGKLYVAPKRQMDLRAIEREQTVKEQLYLFLLQKREEAEITSNIMVPNSRIIDKASSYGAYLVSPNKKKIYISAIFLGLCIPFLILYLKALFNTKLQSRIELESLTSVPMLGSIPRSKIKNKITLSRNDRSPVAEAFRMLNTNLKFFSLSLKKETGKVIFVTSSISGEGKTFISSNLAKTLAIAENKVAYLDADFRSPNLQEFIDTPRSKKISGLVNYITNEKLNETDVIYSQKGEDGIDIIPAGTIPPNPTGLLVNKRFKSMFSYLEANYDYIIVDTPPVSQVTDTLLICELADITIYVVREGYTDKRLLEFPQKFHQTRRLVNLAVVNNSEKSSVTSSYGYGNPKN